MSEPGRGSGGQSPILSFSRVLGIDTSAYRTSLAIVDGETLLAKADQLLPVPAGERGLRPSDSVYLHLNSIQELLPALASQHRPISAVAASTRPRPQPDSHLPPFRVGETVGRSVAAVLGVPFWETSHQEGHIQAALFAADTPLPQRFLAFHLSGGTSDLLLVNRRVGGFSLERLGGGMDLHAGQMIDRVGVALGLGFPSGPQLEFLAAQAQERNLRIPSFVRGMDLSFSGPTSQALRWIQAGLPAAEIAWAVQESLARGVEKVLRQGIQETQIHQVLLFGGVAGNQAITARLRQRLGLGVTLALAPPEFSGDNAVGVALLGAQGVGL